MLRGQDITVGKWYVNNKSNVARAVVRANEKTVQFNTHHLNNGNSCGSASECTKADFMRWADHEATPAEAAKLKSHEMEALFRAPQSSNQAKLKHSKAIDPPTITSRAR